MPSVNGAYRSHSKPSSMCTHGDPPPPPVQLADVFSPAGVSVQPTGHAALPSVAGDVRQLADQNTAMLKSLENLLSTPSSKQGSPKRAAADSAGARGGGE